VILLQGYHASKIRIFSLISDWNFLLLPGRRGTSIRSGSVAFYFFIWRSAKSRYCSQSYSV